MISPSYIPTLIIESPLTFKVKTSLDLGIRLAGSEKYSLGISIASIGIPAVTFPRNGTSTISFALSMYSFGTNISNVRFLLFPFFIYPFSSNLVK